MDQETFRLFLLVSIDPVPAEYDYPIFYRRSRCVIRKGALGFSWWFGQEEAILIHNRTIVLGVEVFQKREESLLCCGIPNTSTILTKEIKELLPREKIEELLIHQSPPRA